MSYYGVSKTVCLSKGLLPLSPHEGQKQEILYKTSEAWQLAIQQPANTWAALQYTVYLKLGSSQNLSNCLLPQLSSNTSKNALTEVWDCFCCCNSLSIAQVTITGNLCSLKEVSGESTSFLQRAAACMNVPLWQGLWIAGFPTPSFLPPLRKGMMDRFYLLRSPLPSNSVKDMEIWLSI